MYAVIKTGGKQYRVAPGDTIRIERVDGKVGEKVNFGSVLAVTQTTKRFCWARMPAKPASAVRLSLRAAPRN